MNEFSATVVWRSGSCVSVCFSCFHWLLYHRVIFHLMNSFCIFHFSIFYICTFTLFRFDFNHMHPYKCINGLQCGFSFNFIKQLGSCSLVFGSLDKLYFVAIQSMWKVFSTIIYTFKHFWITAEMTISRNSKDTWAQKANGLALLTTFQ